MVSLTWYLINADTGKIIRRSHAMMPPMPKCQGCKGTGKMPDGKTCGDCGGTGIKST